MKTCWCFFSLLSSYLSNKVIIYRCQLNNSVCHLTRKVSQQSGSGSSWIRTMLLDFAVKKIVLLYYMQFTRHIFIKFKKKKLYIPVRTVINEDPEENNPPFLRSRPFRQLRLAKHGRLRLR